MSGTVNVEAIQGHPPDMPDFMKMASDYQALRNAKAQEQAIRAGTLNTQQSTSTAQQQQQQNAYDYATRQLASVLALPPEQRGPASYAMLNANLKAGNITQEQYANKVSELPPIGSDPALFTQAARQHLYGALSAQEQVAGATPAVHDTSIGGQMLGRQTPSALQRFVDPNNPENANIVSGGNPQNLTLSPEAKSDFQDVIVRDANGNYGVQQVRRGQANPSLVAPTGSGIAGAGGGLGGGSYPTTPAGAQQSPIVPMGTQEQVGKNVENYESDMSSVPNLTTGTQSLHKALQALNAVSTGAGTEGLAHMRSVAVSLGNVLGVDTGGVNVQDMNRAELEKYLTDYARSSATSGRSDASLDAAFKSNASGHINNAAAQDVVRTNIGRDRQKIASVMESPGRQGHNAFKAQFSVDTDPRGFGWDSYTPEQRAQLVKETQGTQGENAPAYKKLARSVNIASRLNLLEHLNDKPLVNVNTAPPTAPPAPTAGPPDPYSNLLQGPRPGA